MYMYTDGPPIACTACETHFGKAGSEYGTHSRRCEGEGLGSGLGWG